VGLVHEVLPEVVLSETSAHDLDAPLWPAEAAYVASATAQRRAEHATGRALARQALARLGMAPTALPADDRGAPTWPAGVVGSLTHCPGLRAAAVARSSDVVALGIDAEPHAPLPEGVLDVVAGAAEQQHLVALARIDPTVAWDRLLFSAKESVYKVWSPATGRWLDFAQVEVSLHPSGTFVARLLQSGLVLRGGSVGELEGLWAVDVGHLVTAVCYRLG